MLHRLSRDYGGTPADWLRAPLWDRSLAVLCMLEADCYAADLSRRISGRGRIPVVPVTVIR